MLVPDDYPYSKDINFFIVGDWFMDQKKIGRYIAEKRKIAGLTQEQLGERLGVSSKAVSKWECGKSMPDVSLFRDLCDQLEININELVAGEDLAADKIIAESEHSIIALFRDRIKQVKRSGSVIAILIAVIVALIAAVLFRAYSNGDFIKNYIGGFDSGADDVKLAELKGEHFVYNTFNITDECQTVILNEHIYRNGKLYKEDNPGGSLSTGDRPASGRTHKGMIGLAWDDAHQSITTSISFDGAISSNQREMGEFLDTDLFREGSTVVGPETLLAKTEIRKGEPIAVFAISFDADGQCVGGALESYMSDPEEYYKDNDWTFIYTLEYR